MTVWQGPIQINDYETHEFMRDPSKSTTLWHMNLWEAHPNPWLWDTWIYERPIQIHDCETHESMRDPSKSMTVRHMNL